MTNDTDVLLVTVGDGEEMYETGLEAIRTLRAGEPVEKPATITFQDEKQLGKVFDEHAFTLLRIIRERAPESIRETARLADRNVKNVHEELTKLEALGAIRFEENGRSRRPVFPYEDLVISPLGPDPDDTTAAAR